MIKYKNVTNYRVFIVQDHKILQVKPNEIVELQYNPFPAKLIEYYDEDILSEENDPLEDSIVIVSDALIEELKQDESKTEKRSRKRKT